MLSYLKITFFGWLFVHNARRFCMQMLVRIPRLLISVPIVSLGFSRRLNYFLFYHVRIFIVILCSITALKIIKPNFIFRIRFHMNNLFPSKQIFLLNATKIYANFYMVNADISINNKCKIRNKQYVSSKYSIGSCA